MISLTRDDRVTLRLRASLVSVAWSLAGSLTVRTFIGRWYYAETQIAIHGMPKIAGPDLRGGRFAASRADSAGLVCNLEGTGDGERGRRFTSSDTIQETEVAGRINEA